MSHSTIRPLLAAEKALYALQSRSVISSPTVRCASPSSPCRPNRAPELGSAGCRRCANLILARLFHARLPGSNCRAEHGRSRESRLQAGPAGGGSVGRRSKGRQSCLLSSVPIENTPWSINHSLGLTPPFLSVSPSFFIPPDPALPFTQRSPSYVHLRPARVAREPHLHFQAEVTGPRYLHT